jgi:hypothetical protein
LSLLRYEPHFFSAGTLHVSVHGQERSNSPEQMAFITLTGHLHLLNYQQWAGSLFYHRLLLGTPKCQQTGEDLYYMFGRKKGSVRMKNWKGLAACGLAAALVFIVSGCAYMHVQMPMGTNFDNTQLGTREGRSSSYSLLWLVAWGDGGTKAAATQGDIKVIRYADTEVKLVLFGMYTRRTTVVYGD